MREGVPGIEWEGVITKKGPFIMGGVGGLATATRDEWMVLAPLANGDKQEVRCLYKLGTCLIVFNHVNY
jgi:hypothetical protein